MREKRNGLRPVTVGRSNEKGYLHYIGQTGNAEDGFDVVALVEMKNGELCEYSAHGLQFDDIETE